MRLPPGLINDFLAVLPSIQGYGYALPGGATPWAGIPDPGLQQTSAAGLYVQYELFNSVSGLGRARIRDVSLQQFLEAASYGFIAVDRDVEVPLSALSDVPLLGGFTFGAAILRPRGRRSGAQRLLGTLSIAGLNFPVVEITGTISYHGVPPSPDHVANAGSSACWAHCTNRAKTGWRDGILTAAHVVQSLSIAQNVPMAPSTHHSTPTSTSLFSVGDCPIDAALLEDSSTMPSGLTQLNLLDPATKPIAPNTPIQLEGRHTTVSGMVLRVNQNPGYYGVVMAERVVHDVYGVPGDSGGLVSNGADGLGIYMGTIPSKTGSRNDGIAQGLWQAAWYLDVTDVYA